MNSSFAQFGKTVKVSTNDELTQAMYNPNIEVVALAEGHYELLNMDVFPGEEVKIFLEGGSQRGPSAECIYFINTRATCWVDANSALQIEAGMLPGGDNCAAVNSGAWSVTDKPVGSTVTFSLAVSVQSQNVTVSEAGVYAFKYLWPNGRYVNGDYIWYDEPVITLDADKDVCGLSTSINASYAVDVPAATQTDTFSYVGPGTATIVEGTAPSWDITVTQCGTYTFTYSTENGPCGPITEDIVIKFFDTPTNVNAGTDQEVCGLDATFTPSYDVACDNGTTPVVGWTKTDGPGTATWTGNSVEVSVCGIYTFTYSVDNSVCTPVTDAVVVKFFDTPTSVNAGPDQEVCGLTAVLAPSESISCENGATPSKTWAKTAGPGTATFTGTTGVAVSVCGIYTFTYTVDNGPCSPVSDVMVVEFFDTPQNVNAGVDQEVCGLEATFSPSFDVSCDNGTAPVEVWTTSGPGTATWTGNTVEVSVCGTYTFTYSVDNGVCTPVTNDVVVKFFDTPTSVNAGIDQEVCGLDASFTPTYNVSCSNGASPTETWTKGGGPGTATFTGNAVEVSTCGTYTFVFTVDNGPCDPVSNTVQVEFFDTPTGVDAGLDQEVCGLEATFTPDFTVACTNGSTPVETWTKASGPGTYTFTGNSVEVSVCGTYTFTYSVDNGPCTPQTNDVVVKFFDTPTNVNAGVDQEICGLTASFTPTFDVSCNNGATPTESWTKAGGPGTATFTGDAVVVSQCGIYTFTYTVDNGPCTPQSNDVVVKFFDTPVLTTPTPFAVCGYETPFIVSATANCNIGTVTETVTTTGKPVGAGDPIITFTGNGLTVKAPDNSIVVDKCGIYTFTYTVESGPCTQTEDFVVTFYEQPDFDIIGTSTPTLCKEYTYSRDDLRLCNFGSVTYTWTITGGYIDDGTPVTSVATVDSETITVVWNNDLGGSLSVQSESVEGLCTSTDTFTVTPSYPLVAGQVKYWNSEETPMPTPFPTYENASYPHDYFYVTLYNGVTAIDTLIVEPRLNEDLTELMSYFEVDLGATYTSTQSIFDVFGCEGYHLAVWDGGLTYHPATYEGVLGANYTYNNWGGVNATDALAIQLMATNINIQGAPYNFTWVGPNTDTPKYGYFSNPTANVNGSITGSGITALDALTTNYRAVGLLDVFPYTGTGGGSGKFSPNFTVAGRMVPSLPYTTWTAPFDLDNVADVEFTKPFTNYLYYSLATNHKYVSETLSLLNTSYINIYYLAKGDVNSSYIPTSDGFNKAAPVMNLEYTDEMSVNKGQIVNVPIRVDRMVQPGAITINLTYNTELIEVMSVNYNTENYMIDAENGIVRIGWFSEIPASFVAGDAIAMIQVRVIGDIEAGTRYFELADGTDIADSNAQSLKDVKLQTNAINSVDAGLFVTNYPNPFNGNTTISYNLPSASNVVLVVFNTMGEEVETLVSTYQEAGTHMVEFGRTDLKAGVYYYRIIVESEGNTVVKTNSMIRMQ